MAVEVNAECPDGTHDPGTCVTADPENINAAGNVSMTQDQWDFLRGASKLKPAAEPDAMAPCVAVRGADGQKRYTHG